MKKWNVKISFIIQANTRPETYGIVGHLIHKHMRDFASIESISRSPLSDPDEWIAINEPIKAQG